MESIVVIADIAGQFSALKRLMARFPEDQKFVFLGDLIDRGPDSDKVLQLAMTSPNITTLLGNHEHMMLDFCRNLGYYDHGLWLMNDGGPTYRNYLYEIPESVLDWVAKLPLYYMTSDGGCLVTHAPQASNAISYPTTAFTLDFIWNRHVPPRQSYFQVFGHNSHWGVRSITDDTGAYALCIDASQQNCLTAFEWPSKRITQEPYD